MTLVLVHRLAKSMSIAKEFAEALRVRCADNDEPGNLANVRAPTPVVTVCKEISIFCIHESFVQLTNCS